jgi:hypothetical protein
MPANGAWSNELKRFKVVCLALFAARPALHRVVKDGRSRVVVARRVTIELLDEHFLAAIILTFDRPWFNARQRNVCCALGLGLSVCPALQEVVAVIPETRQH